MNNRQIQAEAEVYQPEANIIILIERLAAVLRLEGEDLIADNILLQSQLLGEEARSLIDSQRRKRGENNNGGNMAGGEPPRP